MGLHVRSNYFRLCSTALNSLEGNFLGTYRTISFLWMSSDTDWALFCFSFQVLIKWFFKTISPFPIGKYPVWMSGLYLWDISPEPVEGLSFSELWTIGNILMLMLFSSGRAACNVLAFILGVTVPCAEKPSEQLNLDMLLFWSNQKRHLKFLFARYPKF